MIGIVIVSHSAGLADGVLELAREMAGSEVKLVAAGGLDLPGRPLGTDPGRVAKAIEEAWSPDGVLVLMDLGSAVLSAEMALELLPPERRSQVVLCSAPLVEGAVSAAVQARLGNSLEQALAEARSALGPKAEHLQEEPPAPVPAAAAEPAEPDALDLVLAVTNRLGLHARPAARFVQTAGRFRDARIQVRNLTNGRGPVPATSINAVTTLGLACGHDLGLRASGPQAGAALEALRDLAATGFGDGVEPSGEPVPAPAETPAAVAPGPGWTGLSASAGLALGPARRPRRTAPPIPRERTQDPKREWARLEEALERTRAEIQATLDEVARRADRQAADLFEAHLLFLADPELLDPARRRVFEDHSNAAAAWADSAGAMAARYRDLPDPYLRARAADVSAVGDQVVRQLLGAEGAGLELDGPGILVVDDLTPAETAGLDPEQVQAFCTALGGPSSHSAILARTFGIPAVVGLGRAILDVPEGTPLLVDAERGRVVPNPDPEALAAFRSRQEERRRAQAEALALRGAPGITRDGRRVEVAANIGSVADARAAVAAGAEGVGLLRTEFLYAGRAAAPDEEAQVRVYDDIAQALEGRPLVIRTLDVGGDKPLPYLDFGKEANPFLGWRAIRMCLAETALFKTQLRAILRVAARHPVKIMFPMVADLGEFRAAKALLAEARAEVRRAGGAAPDRVETGIMVEVPAAALRAEQFAEEVDFFSIGTNDLTQYTLAAERGNARVAGLADPFHPAVLDLVRRVAEAAHARGKWVGLCGELGGDPLAVPLLVGLGLDELSMAPPSVPRAKQLVRELDYPTVRASSLLALQLESAGAVRAAAGRMGP